MAKTKHTPIKTDLQLKRLKPNDKQTDIPIAYSPGLVVRLLPSGKKTFRWNRGVNDKPRIIIYGTYPGLSLKEAIERHEKTRQQLIDGVIDVHADTPKTVAALAELFYSDRIVPHRKRPEAVRQVIDHDILPVIGSAKLTSVNTLLVRRTVKKVVDRGAKAHAGKVLAILKQMLGYAASNGFIEFNPAQPLNRLDLGIKENQKNRTLNNDEIRLFWETLDDSPKLSIQAKAALKLLILLGLRSGELRQAKWSDIDTDKGLLTIPVANQKLSSSQANKAKDFVVPLDEFAIKVFKELEGINSAWIFPGLSGDTPINDKAFGRSVRRLLAKEADGKPVLPVEHFTPHDLRRTMRSNLSMLGIPPHIAERCLNHSLGTIIDTYDQHDYLDERRDALKQWSLQVQIILGNHSNVIAMKVTQ